MNTTSWKIINFKLGLDHPLWWDGEKLFVHIKELLVILKDKEEIISAMQQNISHVTTFLSCLDSHNPYGSIRFDEIESSIANGTSNDESADDDPFSSTDDDTTSFIDQEDSSWSLPNSENDSANSFFFLQILQI